MAPGSDGFSPHALRPDPPSAAAAADPPVSLVKPSSGGPVSGAGLLGPGGAACADSSTASPCLRRCLHPAACHTPEAAQQTTHASSSPCGKQTLGTTTPRAGDAAARLQSRFPRRESESACLPSTVQSSGSWDAIPPMIFCFPRCLTPRILELGLQLHLLEHVGIHRQPLFPRPTRPQRALFQH
jgi:hypothetical protein